ncbi:hypothetical protein [Aneurinibacillus danicus]|jgi:hypothetical protein|uniref:Uncharacterized protein n=1 Tax=Aneurinibacillus danicus TaxID=267746 RepID=A0A511VF86_9BACL|nr:hypothetical protein [Aneurinibacillus danicus]GEN36213.1 hypothetical protein ADA01nite_36730 [Aneurinibacillus danicus]
MNNYLKNSNHLLVWPVLKEVTENDLFFCNIGIRATYEMTGKELLDACLDAWQLNKEKTYRLYVVRADQYIEVPIYEEKNIREIGIRNGDPLEIIAC